MDPVDPKRRGRKLFGARRRHEAASEASMEDQPSATVVDPSTNLESPNAKPVESAAEASIPDRESPPEAVVEGSLDGAEDEAPAEAPDADSSTPESKTPESKTPESKTGEVAMPEATPAGDKPDESPAITDAPAEPVARDSEAGAPEEDDRGTPYDLPRIFAIANQKGGVGKTTTSVNLGASLAEMGYRVLVVDLDPQGNATTGLGVNAREVQGSIYDVIMSDAPVEDCIEPTSLKNLFVVPATIDLAGAEIELVPAFSRELKLRRALHEIREDYDYILIDCPPSLGLLTVNGLAAADDVLVPIQCEYYALEGLSQLIRNVTLVRTNLNPTLDVRGIVLTMYDARTKLADQVEQEVRLHFGTTVYLTVIPRTVRLSEAPSFGQPIILFDPTSRGAVAYRELAKEVSHGATRRSG